MQEYWDNASAPSDNELFTTPVIPTARQEVLTAAAPACSLETYLSDLDSTSNAVAATLADGLVHGQLKRVVASVVLNTTTLTLASAESASYDVITFTVIGDTVDLMWNANKGYWAIIQLIDTDRDLDTPTVA